ncbi:Outer membrane protein TolC [Ferrimonas sediminum]|uniref:Outer membrane protein TolC n=1 Tax=Ferrimonas sediminum TaxID=718193 RepID=A0A1G8RLS9_9GAMM|nr:TolC family protein [Ferrimonas sediminum]SDJ17921.1 Outer membrane protein TolC [Ferrimonas sediminum]
MTNKFTLKGRYARIASFTLLLFLPQLGVAQDAHLTLQKAIDAAVSGDLWQQGNALKKQAYIDDSIAAATLPDPKLNLTAANLPIDSFNFDQEAMTQLKVGITQMFPRGDTLQLKQTQSHQRGELTDYLGQDRAARVAMTVGQLYLDAYLAQQTATLIEKSRGLFEQLVGFTQKSYESAYGKAQQQDVIRAELELSRLDEQLTKVWQSYDSSYQKMLEWLPLTENSRTLDQQRPDIAPLRSLRRDDWQSLAVILGNHPAVKVIEQQRKIRDTEVNIAKQSYKPEWGVNASYGYRADDPMGNSRSDFFTVGLTFDLPIFTSSRQDKRVSAAKYRAEAVETERQLLLRRLRADVESTLAQLERLHQRNQRFQDTLLVQTHQQAKSALNAYTADIGDFAEVMRAHIAELNTQIEAEQIQVERLKQTVKLNYLLVGTLY